MGEQSAATSELYNIMLSISKLTDNPKFKRQVYDEVAKKFDGDFNVLIEDLLKNPASLSKERSSLTNAVWAAKSSYEQQLYPQIYIPNFEELQKDKIAFSSRDRIVFVIWDGKETKDNTYPGYALNEEGYLERLDYRISEEFAKENEVWCISYNERVNSKNMADVAGKAGISNQEAFFNRCNGCNEYLWQIRVPDYGAIEGWPAGDLELKLTAATAAIKVIDGQLPQVDKDLVDNGQWYAMQTFLFAWDTGDHGKFLNMHWVEVDAGGTPGQHTITIPPQAGFPGVSYTFTVGENDEDLGEQLVQYDDAIGRPYGVGLFYWKNLNIIG